MQKTPIVLNRYHKHYFKILDNIYVDLLTDYLLFKGKRECIEKRIDDALVIKDDVAFNKVLEEYFMLLEDCE